MNKYHAEIQRLQNKIDKWERKRSSAKVVSEICSLTREMDRIKKIGEKNFNRLPNDGNVLLSKVVSIEDYHLAMIELLPKIDCDFDCIVALKRSGWIMGAFYSNQTGKPVFTPSEIKSIPDKYKNVLIVDDKICKGKALKKVENKLRAKGKSTHSACLYVEGYFFPDYYSKFLDGKIVRMWYEHHCGSVCPCGRCLDEVDIKFKQCYECGRYWGQTDL